MTHWFTPKSRGYGAAPANWKGWAAIMVFIGLQLALAFTLMIGPANAAVGPQVWQVWAWFLAAVGSTVAFVWLCRRKTLGDWHWR